MIKKPDLFSGNCGMYAIALGKKAQSEGKRVEMLLLTPKGTDFSSPEGTIYHVGAKINGRIYDGRGPISLKRFTRFAYTVHGDPSPEVHYFKLSDALVRFLRQNMDWDTSWQEFLREMTPERRALKRRGKKRRDKGSRTEPTVKGVR